MISATPTQQRQLLELQRVDTAIRQLRTRRANLPEQQELDDNADTLSRIASDYAENRDRLEELQRRHKRLEDDIATVESRRKSEEGRMYSGTISSEKELSALKSELSSLKRRKSDLEDELLEVMEQREETESLVETLKQRHTELNERAEELTAARDNAATGIDAELAARQEERDAVAVELPEEVLSYYEDLRERKGGVAVAELSGRTCQGCRLQLTAFELEDVRERAGSALAKCEQCDRILVPTD